MNKPKQRVYMNEAQSHELYNIYTVHTYGSQKLMKERDMVLGVEANPTALIHINTHRWARSNKAN